MGFRDENLASGELTPCGRSFLLLIFVLLLVLIAQSAELFLLPLQRRR
jgi:hypothetical protein